VVLLGALLLSVHAWLRAAQHAKSTRFLHLALFAAAWIMVFVYALYALDEPLTFERINVLVGDVVGVGGREVLATVVLSAAKYAIPMWLSMVVVGRELRRGSSELWSLIAWSFNLRLAAGIAVVSHHPLNFGEVTRIIGESIFATSLLLAMVIAGLLSAWARPAWRGVR
jgi:hypothetical protein